MKNESDMMENRRRTLRQFVKRHCRLHAMVLAVIALVMAGCTAKEPQTPPNIILFLVDDLRWDELGYSGSPVPTPNIDKLAAKGIRFDNAFVTSSLCSPSRASFLTGAYPHTHGVVGNTTDIDFETMPTIGSLLQSGGYYTAMIGKWHMGKNSAPRPGFDYWFALPGQGQYFDPKFNDNGVQVQIEGYNTDILTDKTLAFLAQRDDQPYYLHLSYKAVHGPFLPSSRYKDSLDAEDFSELSRPNAKRAATQLRKRRAETIRSVDESIGAIVSQLKKTGELKNTVLVFTSDNGYLFGEHGRGDKRVFYEESIRIPWIMHYPALRSKQKTVDEPVLNIDFLPSMLDLAGVPVPESIQGRSFIPLLAPKGRRPEGWRDHWVYEYINEEEFPHIPTHLAVVTPELKYVHFPEGPGLFQRFDGEDMLFDLSSDPYEMENVIKDEKHVAAVQEMRMQLAAFVEEYDFALYPLDPEKINKRINFLYKDKQASWFKVWMDRVYPEGYPGWEPPASNPEMPKRELPSPPEEG